MRGPDERVRGGVPVLRRRSRRAPPAGAPRAASAATDARALAPAAVAARGDLPRGDALLRRVDLCAGDPAGGPRRAARLLRGALGPVRGLRRARRRRARARDLAAL